MSAGSFVRSKYEYGKKASTVLPIRVQPETISFEIDSVENTPPTAAITEGWPSARVSGGRRGIGIYARMVSFVITSADKPPGYKVGGVLSIPVLNKALAAKIAPGATGTYTIGGTAYEIEVVGQLRDEVVK